MRVTLGVGSSGLDITVLRGSFSSQVAMTIAAFILGLIGTLTGCLALWIEWLTYRRDSAKLQLDASREQQASEPFFKWTGWEATNGSGQNEVTLYFDNEGEAVTELEIRIHGDIQAVIWPKDYLGERAKGKIVLSQAGVVEKVPLPDLTFEVSYITRLNQRSKQVFNLPTNKYPRPIKDPATK